MNKDVSEILLVEDNDDDAFLTQRALQSVGITEKITRCRDGQAVIDYLIDLTKPCPAEQKMCAPDLILLDLKIPRLGGLEVLKWIRSHEVFHPVVVLALTSSSQKKDVHLAYQLNINAYLVKPSSLNEMTQLARTIRDFWLGQIHLIRPSLKLGPPSELELT